MLNPFVLANAEAILHAAKEWAVFHARFLSTDDDIRTAIQAGEEFEWLEYAEAMWDDLNIDLEEAGLEDEEFLVRVEEAARAAAKEEGERCCRELSLDEVLDLPFDDPDQFCDC